MLKKASVEPTTITETPSWIRKCRKWMFRAAICLLLVIAAFAVFLKLSFDRVEAEAALLNRTGVSLNKFFKEFSSALEAKDIDSALSCFSDSKREISSLYQVPFETRDAVQSYHWKSDSIGEPEIQLSVLVAEFEELEFVKTKIMSMREAVSYTHLTLPTTPYV